MGVLRQKRQESSLRTLARGSLSIARAHAVLTKTEKHLEKSIARENKEPPKTCVGKTRFYGQKTLHSKQILLAVVILNILDCALVLTELLVDVYFIKDVINYTEDSSATFIKDMRTVYPTELEHIGTDNIEELRHKLLAAQITFTDHHATTDNNTHSSNDSSATHVVRKRDVYSNTHLIVKRSTSEGISGQSHKPEYTHSSKIKVAHACHYASVAILFILLIENIMKIFCNGKEYFEKKLEVFDGFIVVASLVADLVLIKGIHSYDADDVIITLTFLIPWRIIRVVNSLIVIVMDHEHFRMKLMYKQKKKITNELKDVKKDNKTLQTTLNEVKNFAIKEGVSAQAINGLISFHNSVNNNEKKHNSGFASSLFGKASDVLSKKTRVSTPVIDHMENGHIYDTVTPDLSRTDDEQEMSERRHSLLLDGGYDNHGAETDGRDNTSCI